MDIERGASNEWSSFEATVQNLAQAVRPLAPQRACLFGSAVDKGLDARDFDILVIADTFDDVYFPERRDMISFPDYKPIDTWLYTPAEFEALYPESNPVRKSIENSHIDLLYNNG